MIGDIRGIDNWNTICRWAFCLSIRNADALLKDSSEFKSNLEMTWKTFAGPNDKLFLALLRNDHAIREIQGEKICLSDVVVLHIERGVSVLRSANGNSTASVLLRLVA